MLRNKKKVILLIIAVISSLVLCSCSSETDKNTLIVSISANCKDNISESLEMMEAEFPKVTFKYETYDTYNDYIYQDRMNSKDGEADIVFLNEPESLSKIELENYYPLTDMSCMNNVIYDVRKNIQRDNDNYFIPTDYIAVGELFNREYYDADGNEIKIFDSEENRTYISDVYSDYSISKLFYNTYYENSLMSNYNKVIDSTSALDGETKLSNFVSDSFLENLNEMLENKKVIPADFSEVKSYETIVNEEEPLVIYASGYSFAREEQFGDKYFMSSMISNEEQHLYANMDLGIFMAKSSGEDDDKRGLIDDIFTYLLSAEVHDVMNDTKYAVKCVTKDGALSQDAELLSFVMNKINSNDIIYYPDFNDNISVINESMKDYCKGLLNVDEFKKNLDTISTDNQIYNQSIGMLENNMSVEETREYLLNAISEQSDNKAVVLYKDNVCNMPLSRGTIDITDIYLSTHMPNGNVIKLVLATISISKYKSIINNSDFVYSQYGNVDSSTIITSIDIAKEYDLNYEILYEGYDSLIINYVITKGME